MLSKEQLDAIRGYQGSIHETSAVYRFLTGKDLQETKRELAIASWNDPDIPYPIPEIEAFNEHISRMSPPYNMSQDRANNDEMAAKLPNIKIPYKEVVARVNKFVASQRTELEEAIKKLHPSRFSDEQVKTLETYTGDKNDVEAIFLHITGKTIDESRMALARINAPKEFGVDLDTMLNYPDDKNLKELGFGYWSDYDNNTAFLKKTLARFIRSQESESRIKTLADDIKKMRGQTSASDTEAPKVEGSGSEEEGSESEGETQAPKLEESESEGGEKEGSDPEEEEEEAPAPKVKEPYVPKKSKKAAPKVEESEEETPAPKKCVKEEAPVSKKKKRVEESESEEETPAPKKKRVEAPVSKKKKLVEEEEEEPKKTQTAGAMIGNLILFAGITREDFREMQKFIDQASAEEADKIFDKTVAATGYSKEFVAYWQEQYRDSEDANAGSSRTTVMKSVIMNWMDEKKATTLKAMIPLVPVPKKSLEALREEY